MPSQPCCLLRKSAGTVWGPAPSFSRPSALTPLRATPAKQLKKEMQRKLTCLASLWVDDENGNEGGDMFLPYWWRHYYDYFQNLHTTKEQEETIRRKNAQIANLYNELREDQQRLQPQPLPWRSLLLVAGGSGALAAVAMTAALLFILQRRGAFNVTSAGTDSAAAFDDANNSTSSGIISSDTSPTAQANEVLEQLLTPSPYAGSLPRASSSSSCNVAPEMRGEEVRRELPEVQSPSTLPPQTAATPTPPTPTRKSGGISTASNDQQKRRRNLYRHHHRHRHYHYHHYHHHQQMINQQEQQDQQPGECSANERSGN